jgi:putative Holliday junction resolvase
MSRTLGVDYGEQTNRTGPLGSGGNAGFPYSPSGGTPVQKSLLEQLRLLIRDKEISLIVVGIPRNMDGSYGPSADNAQQFALRLKESLLVPVTTVDERLSTVQAERLLRAGGKNSRQQRQQIDSASAQIILQSYLDSNTAQG